MLYFFQITGELYCKNSWSMLLACIGTVVSNKTKWFEKNNPWGRKYIYIYIHLFDSNFDKSSTCCVVLHWMDVSPFSGLFCIAHITSYIDVTFFFLISTFTLSVTEVVGFHLTVIALILGLSVCQSQPCSFILSQLFIYVLLTTQTLVKTSRKVNQT